MKTKSLILLLVLCSTQIFAEAPVVDDSENFSFYRAENQRLPAPEALSSSAESEAPSDNRLQLLLVKFEQMQQEIVSLRGQVEAQAYEIKKLKAQTSQQQVTRPAVKQNPASPSSAVAESKPDSITESVLEKPAKRDSVDEQLSYLGAFELVRHRDYDKAIPAMRSFIKDFSDGPYAANAHYWLGELFLIKGQYTDALKEFKIVIQQFSDSNKIAAAKLKLGVTYQKLGDKIKAREQYASVSDEFPDTSAATLARVKLQAL